MYPRSPYHVNGDHAAGAIRKMADAVGKGIGIYGTMKTAPLKAKEAEERTAKVVADRKAKTEANAAATTAATDAKNKTRLDQKQAEADIGIKAHETKTDMTTNARIKLKQTLSPAQKLAADKAKAKANTKNTTTPKPAGNAPAVKKTVRPAGKLTPAKSTVKPREDNTSIGRSVPNIFGPTNPKKPQPKKVKPNLDPNAAERYTD
jgi:membrane protein involved in colicin uptake